MAKKKPNEPYTEPVMNHNVLIDTMEKIGFGNSSTCIGKNIIVINNFDVAVQYAMENKVVYITNDVERCNMFEMFTSTECGDDDIPILVKDNDWLAALKEVINMKFDVAIMNPPYDRNLHLKILEQVISITNKVVNISPVRWLQDPFAPHSPRSDYRKFEDSVSKKIESLDVISAKKATELFGASFTMNLGIYVCSKQGGYNYHHNDPLINKIVQKTISSPLSTYSLPKVQTEKEFSLCISGIYGGKGIMNRSYESQLKLRRPNQQTHNACNYTLVSFDTEAECCNFYNCYCHPFMHWLYRIWKTDNMVMNTKIPYFGNYTHPWDYKDFFGWFDLTKEEQKRVMKEIAEMQAE